MANRWPMHIKFLLVPATLLSLLLLVSGCTTLADFFRQRPQALPPASELYAEGETQLGKGRYDEARTAFRKVVERHPSRPSAARPLPDRRGLLPRGKFDKAIKEFEAFLALYPRHEIADLVQYRLAMSYYDQMKPVEQDQEITRKAMEAFKVLVREYPESRYAADALAKIDVCRGRLAQKELWIAAYYINQGNPAAARLRLEKVLKEYPRTLVIPEALFRLAEVIPATAGPRTPSVCIRQLATSTLTRSGASARRSVSRPPRGKSCTTSSISDPTLSPSRPRRCAMPWRAPRWATTSGKRTPPSGGWRTPRPGAPARRRPSSSPRARWATWSRCSPRRAPGQEVVLDADSHIFNYEGAGAAVFGGVQTLPVKTARGFLTPEQVREHIRPNNIHIPMTGLVAVENTHNRHGGTCCTPEEIEAVAAAAHAAGVPVHLDGARLFNAAVALGRPGGRLRAPGGLAHLLPVQGPRRPGGLAGVRLARARRPGPAGAQDAGRRHAAGGRAGRGRPRRARLHGGPARRGSRQLPPARGGREPACRA